MKVKPLYNYVLCKLNNCKKETVGKDFMFQKENMLIYEIIDIGKMPDDFNLCLNVGDSIVCSSSGTKISHSNDEVYLFNKDSIIGKID